jgi:hypothetical protein
VRSATTRYRNTRRLHINQIRDWRIYHESGHTGRPSIGISHIRWSTDSKDSEGYPRLKSGASNALIYHHTKVERVNTQICEQYMTLPCISSVAISYEQPRFCDVMFCISPAFRLNSVTFCMCTLPVTSSCLPISRLRMSGPSTDQLKLQQSYSVRHLLPSFRYSSNQAFQRFEF